MELSKKTTILMTPALHERLAQVSKETGKSMGELIREACEQRYLNTVERRLAALNRLSQLNGPVSDIATMKEEYAKRYDGKPGLESIE